EPKPSTMLLYYFICLSIMLTFGFHDGFVGASFADCSDDPNFNCRLLLMSGRCDNPLWRAEYEELCPRTCGFC
ncbi:hypothetical protein V3C99_011815, partial [Haemonchus contortus]|uniref:ShKT domain-containing protein n=1 Tax=Haemonchus contortus TaxID=6289 RepID=A0A7I4Y6H3_HAECO